MQIAILILLVLILLGLVVLIWMLNRAPDKDATLLQQQLSHALGGELARLEGQFKDNREELSKISREGRQELQETISHLRDSLDKRLSENTTAVAGTLSQNAKDTKEDLQRQLHIFDQGFKANIGAFGQMQGQKSDQLNEMQRQKFGEMEQRQNLLIEKNENRMEQMRRLLETKIEALQKDNAQRLEEMRATVNEKLQSTLEKRLGDSFRQVSERLELVHKGLGEMQTIATGVGDLKKVLSNVKTRGILGEYQLGHLIEQLLTPDQYGKETATKKGSQDRVEYAIKLPGRNDDQLPIWMPIDSKFPMESFEQLLQAYDTSDPKMVESAQKILAKAIEGFAKDISSKYIDPPHTTDFGIMFLPTEGLFAEALRIPGFIQKIQESYKISITGPTTLSALLNSLQMGFKTLAVQKRSSEVWKTLEAVKTEFGKFAEQLEKVDKQLSTASKSLDELRNARTNQINKQLRNVSSLTEDRPKNLSEHHAVDD